MCVYVCVCVSLCFGEESLTISRHPASAVLTLSNLMALSRKHSVGFNFHHNILLWMNKKVKGG